MVKRVLSRFQRSPASEQRSAGKVNAPATPDGSDAGLLLTGVAKKLPGHDQNIIDGVDLALPRGATASITGPNGAGKTTLLRVLAGLVKADRGTVRLNGLDSERDGRAYRATIGFLSAGNTGLFARLSVRRHLEYWSRLALLPPDAGRRRVASMLDEFALHELADRRVDRLSMGQRQRVRAALTFLHEPDLLLLDEPQNSLDAEGTAMLKNALDEAIARGGCALWCSPAGMMEGGVFDHRYLMRAGQLRPR